MIKSTICSRIVIAREFLLAAALVILSACSTPVRPLPSPSLASSPSPSPSASPTPTPPPSEVPTMDTAETVLAALVDVEPRIRSSEAATEWHEYLGRTQQLAYRTLVNTPEWRDRVVKSLPAELKPIAEVHIQAGEQLRSLTKPITKLPSWKIIAPPPASELLGYYKEAEAEFGVRWQYLASIHLVETRMGRIRGTSSAGAQGPMQFIPSTWDRYGQGDINDPRDSILAAGRYLKAAGAPGNMDKALHAYNPTPKYVIATKIYAEQMIADERTYSAYYHWQVYVRTVNGDVLLEAGYGG